MTYWTVRIFLTTFLKFCLINPSKMKLRYMKNGKTSLKKIQASLKGYTRVQTRLVSKLFQFKHSKYFIILHCTKWTKRRIVWFARKIYQTSALYRSFQNCPNLTFFYLEDQNKAHNMCYIIRWSKYDTKNITNIYFGSLRSNLWC